MNKKTTDGKRGGNLVGKPHYNKKGKAVGGIKAVVTDNNNQPVELEGGEVIINKEASKRHWKELSKINQSAGGGVPIGPPIDPHEADVDEYKKGGKIEFNRNKIPNKWILKYAQNIKDNHPDVWDLGGNIFGNEAFKNLKRVAERGYWLDSEKWMMIKWRSYVARHKKDFRIAGVIAMLKWVDKVDRGWPYMKDLIEAEIRKRANRKKLGGKLSKKASKKPITWKDKYNTKYGFKKGQSHSIEDIAKTTGISKKGIQEIYNKGIGAYKTNPSSVRPNVTSKEQWAYARVYSAVMGGKASDVDKKELKMKQGGQTKAQKKKFDKVMKEFEEGELRSGSKTGPKVTNPKQAVAIAYSESKDYEKGGNITNYGIEYKLGDTGQWMGRQILDITISKITDSSVYFWTPTNSKEVRKKKVDFNKMFYPRTHQAKKPVPKSKPAKKPSAKSSKNSREIEFENDLNKTFSKLILRCIKANDSAKQNNFFEDGKDYLLQQFTYFPNIEEFTVLVYRLNEDWQIFGDEEYVMTLSVTKSQARGFLVELHRDGEIFIQTYPDEKQLGSQFVPANTKQNKKSKPKKKEPRKPFPKLKKSKFDSKLNYKELFVKTLSSDARLESSEDVNKNISRMYQTMFEK